VRSLSRIPEYEDQVITIRTFGKSGNAARRDRAVGYRTVPLDQLLDRWTALVKRPAPFFKAVVGDPTPDNALLMAEGVMSNAFLLEAVGDTVEAASRIERGFEERDTHLPFIKVVHGCADRAGRHPEAGAPSLASRPVACSGFSPPAIALEHAELTWN